MIRFLPFVLAALVPMIGELLAASDWLAIPLLIVLAAGLWMIAPGDAVPARAAAPTGRSQQVVSGIASITIAGDDR